MSVDELYRMLMSDIRKSQPIKFPVGLNRIAQQVLCMPEPRQRLAKRVGREVSFTSDCRCAGKFESKLARGALLPLIDHRVERTTGVLTEHAFEGNGGDLVCLPRCAKGFVTFDDDLLHRFL